MPEPVVVNVIEATPVVVEVTNPTPVVVEVNPTVSAGQVEAVGAEAFAQSLRPTTVKTSAYTASPGDYVPVNISGGSVPITVPSAPADKTRIGVKIVAVSSTPGSTTATISRSGTDVFNIEGGGTSLTLSAKFQGVILQYKASTGIWYVQTTDTPLNEALGAALLGTDGAVGGPSGSALSSSVVSSSAVSKKGQIYKATGTNQQAEPVPRIFYAQKPTGGKDTANLEAAFTTAVEAAESEPNVRAMVKLAPAVRYKTVNLHLPPVLAFEGSGPGILDPGATEAISLIEPYEECEACLIVPEGHRWAVRNMGFIARREFNADAIAIATTGRCKWFDLSSLTFLNFKGSALRAGGYTLWESVIAGLHARGCGDGTRRAVYEVLDTSGSPAETNNVTFRDCRGIFPHGRAFYAYSTAYSSSENEPGIRWLSLEGSGGEWLAGKSESEAGPESYEPYPLIVVDGFSDLRISAQNIGAVMSGEASIELKGSGLSVHSARGSIVGNRLGGPVRLNNCRDVRIEPNLWTFGHSSETPNHVETASNCTHITCAPGQIVSGSKYFEFANEGANPEPPTPSGENSRTRVRRTGGNITVSSTEWKSLATILSAGAESLDLVLGGCYVGQYVELSIVGQWANEAITGRFDIAVVNATGEVLRWVSSESATQAEFGIPSMIGPSGATTPMGAPVLYGIQSGDLTEGKIRFRPYAKVASAGNKVLRAEAATPLVLQAKNLG
jgi:hypothetical protein